MWGVDGLKMQGAHSYTPPPFILDIGVDGLKMQGAHSSIVCSRGVNDLKMQGTHS